MIWPRIYLFIDPWFDQGSLIWQWFFVCFCFRFFVLFVCLFCFCFLFLLASDIVLVDLSCQWFEKSSYDMNQKIQQKRVVSKISVDSNITFICMIMWILALVHRLLLLGLLILVDGKLCVKIIALISHWNDFCLIPLGRCASWRRAKDAKNSKFEIFERVGSVPLTN